jgi:DNA-binding MarR family transcriptional regulator
MPQNTSLEQSYLLLVEFLLLSKRRVFELGSALDLTGMQAMMLFLLDRPRAMHDFKKIFNCDASNVTGIVDGLEAKGLAARYENATDRRVKMIKLEAKGSTIRTKLMRNLTSQDSALLSALSPNELQTFVSLLQKVTAAAY